MAYFPNGMAGEAYEAEFCDHCIHQPDCAVWSAHMIHNYKECNNKDSILHILIPMDEDRNPLECRMFSRNWND